MNTLGSIDARYAVLAKSGSSLSCGNAIHHADPQPGETCVDLGCGRGKDCIRLADAVGLPGAVYGIDVCASMIDAAQAAVADAGATTITLINSPVHSLPLASDSVDLVISNCTINHADDKAAVWMEVFRVLKSGGRFVVSDIYSLEPVPVIYRNDPMAVSECWAGAGTRDEYITTLHKSGFVDMEILEESLPYEKGSILVSSFTIRGFKPAPPDR